MTVTSLSDLYFIALGLFSYNVLFDILCDTGIIYLPIVMVIYEALTDGFESSKNMADTAFTLKSMEVKIYTMIIAYSLAVVPVHSFTLDGVSQYTKQCQANSEEQIVEENAQDLLQLGNGQFENPTENVLTAKDMLVNISGYDVEMPVILKLTLKLGTGVGLYGVKQLPCTINVVGVSRELLNNQIKDTRLKAETKQFIHQCYNRAKNYGYTNQDQGLPWVADPDTGDQPWPGHGSFMNSAYYGNETMDMTTTVVLDGYESYYEEGKKPTCREWWEGRGAGREGFSFEMNNSSLKGRLINHMDSALVAKLRVFPDRVNNTSEQDYLLKTYYFNPYNFSEILDAEYKDYGNEAEGITGWVGDKISRGLGTVGMLGDAIPSYAGASVIQLAAPMAKGAVLLVIIALLPVAFIVAKYSFKFVVSIHFFLFSVLLWPYLWDLAILVQQSYIEETISDSSMPLWSMVTQPNVMLISKKLTDALFLGFPAILTSLLTAAGLAGGQALASVGGSPGGDVGSAGKGGGKKFNPADKSGRENIKSGASNVKGMANKIG